MTNEQELHEGFMQEMQEIFRSKPATKDDLKQLMKARKAGHGIMVGCNIGLGIKLTETDDHRIAIEVDQAPYGASNPDFKAVRDLMEATAVAWLTIVAPHRLNPS